MQTRYADAPNAQEVMALGYDFGVATAALAHLFEQEQCGTLDYYRATLTGTWLVTIEAYQDRNPSEYRITLSEYMRAFVAGTLPTQQQQTA